MLVFSMTEAINNLHQKVLGLQKPQTESKHPGPLVIKLLMLNWTVHEITLLINIIMLTTVVCVYVYPFFQLISNMPIFTWS